MKLRHDGFRSSRKRVTITLALILATFLFSAGTARADRRSYVWTYEYQTKPPGGVELEHYMTAKTGNLDVVGMTSWEHRVELEVGLTDRWDFSIYQIFNQAAGDAFHYDSFQLRTRYRLGEAGQYPADPLLYFEYRRPQDLTKPNKAEGKLIIARDFQKVNIAVNLIEEVKFAPGSEWETGYTAGISIEPHPIVKIGAEAFGKLATEGNEPHYFGPTVSLAREGWFYSVGLGFGLNDYAEDLQARAILGVDL
jgi:hypothetical protein